MRTKTTKSKVFDLLSEDKIRLFRIREIEEQVRNRNFLKLRHLLTIIFIACFGHVMGQPDYIKKHDSKDESWLGEIKSIRIDGVRPWDYPKGWNVTIIGSNKAGIVGKYRMIDSTSIQGIEALSKPHKVYADGKVYTHVSNGNLIDSSFSGLTREMVDLKNVEIWYGNKTPSISIGNKYKEPKVITGKPTSPVLERLEAIEKRLKAIEKYIEPEQKGYIQFLKATPDATTILPGIISSDKIPNSVNLTRNRGNYTPSAATNVVREWCPFCKVATLRKLKGKSKVMLSGTDDPSHERYDYLCTNCNGLYCVYVQQGQIKQVHSYNTKSKP